MNNDEIENPRPELINSPVKIFVNQAGYKINSEKTAVVTFPAESFSVINESGQICLTGNVLPFGEDKASGERLFRADFSRVNVPGTYRVVCGIHCSLDFRISDNAYDSCFDDLVKAFYFQRCGCELESKFAGVWTHSACHTARARLWENPETTVEVSGGWHDAGDYGRYVTPAACTLAHLLYAYKLYPKVFLRQNINIPDKSPYLPDILAECRYELNWLIKMQRFDGAVWHKATTMRHAPFVMPEQDTEQVYVMPVSSSATADFAAVTALAYTVYKEFDEKFADRLLKSSVAAYDWLEQHPEFTGFHNPDGCNTGTYGENSDLDNRFWAAAELYTITGEQRYYNRLLLAIQQEFSKTALGFASVGGFGALALLLDGKAHEIMLNFFKKEFTDAARRLETVCKGNGWGVSLLPEEYYWGSNMRVLTNGMLFLIADYLEKGTRFRRYALMQLNYILGVNATGYSFISGTGAFSINYPHHRPAFADGIEECIPGFVSGGPNSRREDSFAAAAIPENTPPMKCFIDNTDCYSLNEITVYWNSPAVFVMAGLLE